MMNMKRWSYAKLDKELDAAKEAKDDIRVAACEAELDRRDSAAELSGIQGLKGRM